MCQEDAVEKQPSLYRFSQQTKEHSMHGQGYRSEALQVGMINIFFINPLP
jgi:hypothetical protein